MNVKLWAAWLREHVFVPDVVIVINPEAEPRTIRIALLQALVQTTPVNLRGGQWHDLVQTLGSGELDVCLYGFYRRDRAEHGEA